MTASSLSKHSEVKKQGETDTPQGSWRSVRGLLMEAD